MGAAPHSLLMLFYVINISRLFELSTIMLFQNSYASEYWISFQDKYTKKCHTLILVLKNLNVSLIYTTFTPVSQSSKTDPVLSFSGWKRKPFTFKGDTSNQYATHALQVLKATKVWRWLGMDGQEICRAYSALRFSWLA